ncbi:hypothetical protein ACH5RR_020398 [Cinchona calisaya]|uniref:RING-type domain-containing protein n=1 Tax=Cinchona calisaya TaxID=153742 RepID=A0ABD2ZFI9_9GENT
MESGGVDSPNLRDYLRIKQDEYPDDRNGAPMRTQSNRTLLDVIRDDPDGSSYSKDSRRRWRQFKEKLRLRRQGSGSAWTSSVPVPASDVPIQPATITTSSSNRMMMLSRRDSTRMNMSIPEESSQPDVDLSSGFPRSRSSMLQRNESRAIRRAGLRGINDEMGAEEEEEETTADEDEGEEAEAGGDGAGGEEQPVKMSLMALLAETDKQMGLDGSSYMMEEEDDDDEEEEEEAEDEKVGAGGGGYNNCCVCMVRHKGAAFIPCGHTFCRLCSRELWVQRGNCPLCNNFILEILDIF